MRFAVPLLIGIALIAVRCRSERPPILDEYPLEVDVLDSPQPPATIQDLQARAKAILERDRVPGAAIALVDRDGPIWVGGVGVADLETKRPVDATTVFRVASITKSIVGLGVMRLVEQGKLDLDRPLRELMPDVVIDNKWEATSPVTLGQVLEHTAGLDDMRPSETFVDDDAMTPAAALALNPRSRVVRWRPGSRMAYSNVGTSLAARAIEVATGEPFDVWLRREVLLPLGMRDADFRRTDLLRSRLATGYLGPDRPAEFKPIAHRGAGALLGSATDLAGLVQFWLRRGDGFPHIVSPAGLDRIERTGTLPFPSLDISYGLGNYGDVAHPVKGRGHDGAWPGFLSSYRYFPELGKGYVLLLDATHSRRAYLDLRALLFSYLSRGRTAATPVVAPATPDAAFYAFASPRHQLTGFVERALLGWTARGSGDQVELDPLIGRAITFEPAGDGGYKLRGQSGSWLRFARRPNGRPIMISGFGYAEESSYWLGWIRVKALGLAALLLQLAPIWALAVFGLAAFRRRRPHAIGLTLWPAIAALSFDAAVSLFGHATETQRLGDVCASTVGVFVGTIVFGIAATMGLFSNIAWAVRPDRPPLLARAMPIAMALAVFGFGLWLDDNGIIGLRIWAW